MYYQAKINNGAWLSLAALGASGLRRTLMVAGLDTFEFTITAQTSLTDDTLFAYNSVVSIRRQLTDDVEAATHEYFFKGRVRSVPRTATHADEQISVVIHGPWSWFQNTLYRKSWAEGNGTVSKPRCILYSDAAGNRITTGSQLSDIFSVAQQAGSPLTYTPVTSGITPPFDEQTNLTCAAAVVKVLSLHPHLALWVDYSTATPTLRIGQRTALEAANLALNGQSINIRQRVDLQVPAICIYYERNTTVDGQPVQDTSIDLYPANADRFATDVLTACYDLTGNSITTVSQVIKAEQFPAQINDLAWWTARVPWLANYDSVEISGGAREGLNNYSNILLEGQKQPWMTQSFGKEKIHCKARCIMLDEYDQPTDIQTHDVVLEITTTTCPTGETTYRSIASFDLGETVPTGIAQELYTEWSQLHHEGSITVVDEECPGTHLPGRKLNITGGRAEWATMAAMIKRTSEDIDSGSTTIEFGPPSWTDVDSRVQFGRMTNMRRYARSSGLLGGSITATGVEGGKPFVEIRDGSTIEHTKITLTGSTGQRIVLDPSAITPASAGSGATDVQPRLVNLPLLDSNNNLTFQPAVILSAATAGTVITPSLPSVDPAAPSSYTGVPTFWGEFSGASGGGSTPTTNAWVAKGQAGHSANYGLALILTTRVYLDNSLSTPNLVAEQRRLLFAEDGRLLSISAPFEYVISPTVAV